MTAPHDDVCSANQVLDQPPPSAMEISDARRRSKARLRRAIAFSFAVAAGLVVMFFSTWPLPVLYVHDRNVFVAWGMTGNIIGALLIGAGFLIRRRPGLAPLVLAASGLMLLYTWLLTGRLEATGRLNGWVLALWVDMLPIALAAAAGWMMLRHRQVAVAPVRVNEEIGPRR